MPMVTATAAARPYASISQSPPGDLCLGDDPGEGSFEQFVETTSQKMLDSYVEMKKQAEDDLERISRDTPNPNDPATRKQLEEDRVNRMKNIGMMIIGQWKALVMEEMTLRDVAQTSPDIQEFVQRKRIALTESITKLYHGRDDNSTRRDSQGPSTPARNTLPRTGQKVWRPPPQTTTPNATRRGTPSLPSGSSTVQGSPLDRRTSDGSSSKSFQSWVFELSSPITNRQFHAEPEEISPSDGGSSDPEKSDNEDDAFGSDLESDERPHGRRPSHSNWRMPAPERVRPMPIGNNSNKLWRPSMESIPANAQANNRRVPGSSLERMSTQDPQGSGTQTPSRPTGRGSVDMSNPADKQSWGSIGSDSTSWKARNTWGSLDQPKPPIHHFSRSPVASASPPTQPSDNIQPSPQSFASNVERDVQVLRDPWSNNSNKPWSQSKEVPKFSSQSVSPITIDGTNTRTRVSQQQQQDGDNPHYGRNRSDSDTMSIQNQRLWKPSTQAPTISSPPPFQSTSGSRPMDRQPSYGEPVRSPQFTRTGSDSMKNQSMVSSIPRPEISRSRSPNKLERSRTYDEIPLDSPPPRTRPPPVRSSTEANIYSCNIHPPMVYYSPEPSMIAPSPPVSSREITSRDYAYSKPIEESPIQRPSNMPLSRYPTESLPSNESFSSPDSIGSSLSSSIPSDSDISSLYREQKRLTRLDEETEELERRERELEDRQKKFVDASFEYRERKLSSVNTEMTEVEKRERELQDRRRKVEEQERLLKQKEEELAEKNRRLAREAQEADEKRRRQEEEERKKREEEDAERDRRRQQWEEEERARKEEERLRLEEEKKRKEEERIRAEEDRIRTEEERRRLEEIRMQLAEEHAREVERMRKRMEEEHIREMREAAERKAKEDAERKAREEEERKAREEADRLAREEILRIAKEETARRIKEELEAEAKRVKEEMEKKRKEDEERERKERERLDKEREELEREKERLAKRERERREREREEKSRRERQEREREERERREREERERREREERELREREERERREREERERREKEEQERREKEEQERREKEERERREREEREHREKEERERREREARERREKEERERREREERERREKEERERRENEERERREKAVRERREKEERERREREDRDRQKERERTEREEKARRDRAIKEQEEFDRIRVRTNDTSKQNKFEEELLMENGGLQGQKEMLEFFAQKKQREERQKAQSQSRPEIGAFPFRTSSASAAAAAMPNYTHAGRAGSTSSSSSNWSQRSSASSYAESTWSSNTSRSSASQASQHSSGSTPLRSTPSSSGTTRMPSSENTHKSTGWRGATNDPFHGASASYVPPTESEWKRKQEEQARQQQEQFRRESMKAEQEYMSRATFSTGKDSIVRAWTKYESDWASLKDRTTLRFRIIPWPLLKSISSPDEITANAVGALVLSPHHSPDKKARDRLKEQLLRWHPDRFEGKWLPKVAEEDKEEVKKGVGQVARALNELMNRENNNPFA